MRYVLMMLLMLAGCETAEIMTPCGPAPYSALSGPILQTANDAFIQACNEEIARANGATITRCSEVNGTVSCITQ